METGKTYTLLNSEVGNREIHRWRRG